jgi:hypothetical protein
MCSHTTREHEINSILTELDKKCIFAVHSPADSGLASGAQS